MTDRSAPLRKAYDNVVRDVPAPLSAVTEFFDDDAKRAFLKVAARVRRSSLALVARFKSPPVKPS